MSLTEFVHSCYAYGRRTRILSHHLAAVMPKNLNILDVGCGDGLLTQLISQQRPDVRLRGIDTLVRPRTHIPVDPFDGKTIPYDNQSFDGVMFVDVLHHAEDPMTLLREAARVARRVILIKDHTLQGLFAAQTLRFMDKIGNARHGVALPYNYWPKQRWLDAFDTLGLQIGIWNNELGIYPWPASWVFDRSLHFVAQLYLPGQRTFRADT
jgi:SAM-dependent methyltransferase